MPHRPLLGNWYEEEAYEQDRKRLMQGRSGGLVSASTEVSNMMAKVRHHKRPCTIGSVPEDGFLHFYTPVMLQNADTVGYLNLDLDDRKLTSTGWRLECGTASAEEATLNTVFTLVPAPMPPTDTFPIPEDEVDVVHYGQPFYIMTVSELCDDPLSLASEAKTPSSVSNVSGTLQHVFFTPDGGSAGAMWCADFANAGYQEDMRDRPIAAEDVLILRHNMTTAPLASTQAHTFMNDLGTQYEVGCGRITSYATKRRGGPFANANFWMFIHKGQGQDSTFFSSKTFNETVGSQVPDFEKTATTTASDLRKK